MYEISGFPLRESGVVNYYLYLRVRSGDEKIRKCEVSVCPSRYNMGSSFYNFSSSLYFEIEFFLCEAWKTPEIYLAGKLCKGIYRLQILERFESYHIFCAF